MSVYIRHINDNTSIDVYGPYPDYKRDLRYHMAFMNAAVPQKTKPFVHKFAWSAKKQWGSMASDMVHAAPTNSIPTNDVFLHQEIQRADLQVIGVNSTWWYYMVVDYFVEFIEPKDWTGEGENVELPEDFDPPDMDETLSLAAAELARAQAPGITPNNTPTVEETK